MFKKRYLLTLTVLLLVITAIVPFALKRYRIEKDKVVAVCRDALVDDQIFFSEYLKYESMVFSPWYASVTFSYIEDTAFCKVHRNGSEWEVDGAGYLMLSSTP